jgi:hypothetical protein
MSTATTLARSLGAFSVGLGMLQVLAPRRFASGIGVRPTSEGALATRADGVRELAAGGGLLASERPGAWPWVRVAGDVMDVGLLGLALTRRDTRRGRTVLALGGVAAVLLIDALAGVAGRREERHLAARLRRFVA